MSSFALRSDQARPDVQYPESQDDELPVGTQLFQGQFTITSFLSAGGFGITYVARDSLNREVVIKECFPASFCRRLGGQVGVRSQNRSEDFRSMVALFHQEAINLGRLNHPNIVRVHQVFRDNETAYLAMDYVRGPDLLQTVEGRVPRLSPQRITHLLQRLLDALAHVHDQGFLHRDIAPDNILLDEATGEPVLIDFGAARKDETRKSRALSGLRVVKDGYSPQEFYISGSKQAPCSDLYALAATFSHLITGDPPKTSRERLSAIANRQDDPQHPLVGRVRGYPDGVLAAIDKAMSIFPRDRLQSVAEWQAMLAVQGPVGSASEPPPPASAPAPTALHRDRLVRAAAFTLLLAGLVSMAGELYDRFWGPHQSSQLQIDAPEYGIATATGVGLAPAVSSHPSATTRFGHPSTSLAIARAWTDRVMRPLDLATGIDPGTYLQMETAVQGSGLGPTGSIPIGNSSLGMLTEVNTFNALTASLSEISGLRAPTDPSGTAVVDCAFPDQLAPFTTWARNSSGFHLGVRLI